MISSKIAVINGANLNLLGIREQSIYGVRTLQDIQNNLSDKYCDVVKLSFYQSNIEGEIINIIHSLYNSGCNGVVINPGAYTHTSIAMRDALLGVNIPFVEVHLSNVYSRELFRHKSYISGIAKSVISGCGELGYDYAIDFLLKNFS